jgi:large subunit ribosomal protein L16
MQPKRTKFRKQFKGKISGSAHRGNSVAFGEFGLKATNRCRMTAREIEAARRAISRYVKRGGRIWIRVFPDVPITQKPLEVRMGSGKGNVEYWVAKVLPGKVLFEIEGMSETIAREAFRLASANCARSSPRISARSCSSCAANNSICAWPVPRVRRRNRINLRRCARTLRA